MDTPVCIGFGGLTTVIVSMLKRNHFVENHPKWFALILSTTVSLIGQIYSLKTGHTLAENTLTQLITCISVIFASSVAIHESITHTIQEQLDI